MQEPEDIQDDTGPVDDGDTVFIGAGERSSRSRTHMEEFLEQARATPDADDVSDVPDKPRRILVKSPDGKTPREIPARLGRYLIEGVIGRGGMGVVYRVRQEKLNRPVALKLLLHGEHASDTGRKRFDREAKAIARLRHPNIVSVHEVGEYDGQPFFTMDLIDGISLSLFAEKANIRDTAVIAHLCAVIADAIHYAHGEGVIHRDLKPDNILVDRSGEPVVTDFGLAKDLSSETVVSVAGDIMGTPAFMSPEQACGRIDKIDARSDVYSLGAILYWLLTREEPFTGDTMVETLARVVKEEPPLVTTVNPSIESELCAICLKAMDKVRDKRYQTAGELAEDLRRFLEGYPVLAKPWTWRRAVARYVARHKRPVIGTAVAIVVSVVAATSAVVVFSRTYLDVARAGMTSQDPATRAETVSSLAREIVVPERLKPEELPAAGALLVSLHADPDLSVQSALLSTLADHGDNPHIRAAVDADAAAWLIEAAEIEDSPQDRNLALSAIGRIPRGEFGDYLVSRLGEPNDALRLRIVRSTGMQRPVKAISPLINLTISDPICRGEAQAALDRIYADRRVALFSRQDTAIKKNLKNLGNAMAAHSARVEDLLNEYPGSGRSTPQGPYVEYEVALRSPDVDLRLKAVYELGLTGDAGVISILRGALEDGDGNVGAAAAKALAEIGGTSELHALEEGLASESPALRGNSALAMGFTHSEEALDHLLVALVKERVGPAKECIVRALGELGNRDARPGLQQAARDDPTIAATVERALARLR